MKYEHVLTEVLHQPWALHPERLASFAELLTFRAVGGRLTDEELEARVQAGQARAAARGAGARVGAVAVLPILGMLLPRAEAMNTSGAVSVQRLAAEFQALVEDDTVGTIILDMDSPGGAVGGVAEFADRVFEARTRKHVVAVANPMMASAAYWIGSAAAEIVATPSALVGSIGVYAAHKDISEALAKEGITVTLIGAGAKKTLASEFAPLSDEGRAEIQARVDAFYALFVKAVARGRGVSQQAVREGYGEGAALNAAAAVAAGLVDRIGTLDGVVAGLRGAAASSGSSPLAAVAARKPRAEMVEPDEDGRCPEGYEKREDGLCHLMPKEPMQQGIALHAHRLRLAEAEG